MTDQRAHQRATWPALRDVLSSSGYRRLLGTRLASQAGDGAFQVGLASLVFFSPERAATTSAVAWAFTAALVPYTLVGPVRRRAARPVAAAAGAAGGEPRPRAAGAGGGVGGRRGRRRAGAVRAGAGLPVGQPVLPRRAVGRAPARGAARATSWSPTPSPRRPGRWPRWSAVPGGTPSGPPSVPATAATPWCWSARRGSTWCPPAWCCCCAPPSWGRTTTRPAATCAASWRVSHAAWPRARATSASAARRSTPWP